MDVLIVLPADLAEDAEDLYREQVSDWCAYAGRVAGLPVSPVVLDAHEAQQVDGKLWDSIRRDGVVIAGADPRVVLRAA